MKKFILYTFKIILITIIVFIGFVTLFADGKTDPYYLNVTSPKANSLILGSSRGARGLMPSVFNQSILGQENRMQNFAFTMVYSPYGPNYLKAIKEKLRKTSTHGLFILEVSPIVLSTDIENVNDAQKEFVEQDTFIGNLKSYTAKPNLEYIVRFYNEPFFKIFTNKFFNKEVTLHPDGWLHINVPLDEKSIQQRTSERVNFYNQQFAKNKFSPLRFQFLKETIEYLSQYGQVYLVRLPVANEIHLLESEYMPDFDQKMTQLSSQYHIDYFNFTDHASNYKTVDGDHLAIEDAHLVSSQILKNIDQRLTLKD